MSETKILLVDDVKIFLEIQKDFLRFSPVQILTAYNGIEALRTAALERPHLIVMDVNMPQMDGVTCCKAIREDPVLHSTPAILVITRSGQDDMESYKSAGCNAILHKPLQRREFLNMAYNFLPAIERREPRVSCRMPVTVDEAYLRRSILEPNADVVKGFQPVMPSFPELKDVEVEAIVELIEGVR